MKIKGVSGAEYEEWKPPTETAKAWKPPKDYENVLERQNKSLQDTVVHLTALIHTFGFCRPETQLARMELGEATERYVLNKSYDEKNYGAIAKHVLAQMRAKGEMPDEN